jgi:hypothetical protein
MGHYTPPIEQRTIAAESALIGYWSISKPWMEVGVPARMLRSATLHV